MRPKSPPNKNVSNKASNKKRNPCGNDFQNKTPWKIHGTGFFAEFLGGRYVDVESAEVLIHGMYATQRHLVSTHWVHPPWSPVFSLLRKDAELMPQLGEETSDHSNGKLWEPGASRLVRFVYCRFYPWKWWCGLSKLVGDKFLIHSEKLHVWHFGTMGLPKLLRLMRNEWNQVAQKLATASFHVIVPWILWCTFCSSSCRYLLK